MPIQHLYMFCSIGGIVADDHNQIAACSHSSVELVRPSHSEAPIPGEHNNLPGWVAVSRAKLAASPVH